MQEPPRPQHAPGLAGPHVIQNVGALMRCREASGVLLDLERHHAVRGRPVIMPQNGCWRFYPGGSELYLGAWSVRQNGEQLVFVPDGFDGLTDQDVEFWVVRDEDLPSRF